MGKRNLRSATRRNTRNGGEEIILMPQKGESKANQISQGANYDLKEVAKGNRNSHCSCAIEESENRIVKDESSPNTSTVSSPKASLASLLEGVTSAPKLCKGKGNINKYNDVTSRPSRKLITNGTHDVRVSKSTQINVVNDNEISNTKSNGKNAMVEACNIPNLWNVMYAPKNSEDLIVHKNKVSEVRIWLQGCMQSVNSKDAQHVEKSSSSKVLVVSGPHGSGKTTTVEILAEEMGFEIVSWKDSSKHSWEFINEQRDRNIDEGFLRYHSSIASFENFIFRSCLSALPLMPVDKNNLTIHSNDTLSNDGSQLNLRSEKEACIQARLRSKLIILKDIPLALNEEQRSKILEALGNIQKFSSCPIVIVTTLSVPKGNDTVSHSYSKPKTSSGIASDVFSFLKGKGAQTIQFNPITELKISKYLKTILDKERLELSDDIISAIARQSDGDLRHALNTLQFICAGLPRKWTKKSKRRKTGASKLISVHETPFEPCIMNLACSKDGSIGLFHGLGKLLYNKRRSNSSAEPMGVGIIPVLQRNEMDGFDPEGVLQQSGLQANSIAAFLHENITSFVDDDAILDLAGCLENISISETLCTSSRKAKGRGGFDEMVDDEPVAGGLSLAEATAASVAARGVCFWNSHPAPRRWHPLKAPCAFTAEEGTSENSLRLLHDMMKNRMKYGGATSMETKSILATEFLPSLRSLHQNSPAEGTFGDQRNYAEYLYQQPGMWTRIWEGSLHRNIVWKCQTAKSDVFEVLELDNSELYGIEDIEDPDT